MRNSKMLLLLSTAMFMTAPSREQAEALTPSEVGAGAGEISATEAVTLPDTTEGNRGPSRTANTSGNVGDPTKVLHGDIGETIVDPEEAPVIANSTNAITELAYSRLTPVNEVEVQWNKEVDSIHRIKPLFAEILGTTNVARGPFNSAFKSIRFKYPEQHGQRACIIHRDGRVRFLSEGSTYADWQGQVASDESVVACAIVYFNQNKQTEDNPYVSIRWYKPTELPPMATNMEDDKL